MFVGLAPVEHRGLRLPARSVDARRHDPERHVCGVEPVVRQRRDRVRHRRRPVRKRHRAERRFGRRPSKYLPAQAARQRRVVLGRQLHDQIVRMLAVVDRLAVALLARGEQVGIAAARDGERLEAEHAAERQSPAREGPLRHAHEPVDAAALVGPAIARLVQELDKGVEVPHQLPAGSPPVPRVDRRRFRQPTGAGALARHGGHVVPLMRRLWRLVPGVIVLRRRRLMLVLMRCRRLRPHLDARRPDQRRGAERARDDTSPVNGHLPSP